MTPPSLQSADEIAAKATAVFGRAASRDHVPGIAYGVVLDGVLVQAGGIGSLQAGRTLLPGADSHARICSMSKSFLAAAILVLRDEGKLALDDPITDYAPCARAVRLPTADSPALTVRSLMSMAGGLPADDAWADRQLELSREELSRLLERGVSFARAPGTAFEYSNLGWAMLALAVRTVTGYRAQDFISNTLLVPLRLTATGWDPPARGEIMIGHRWQDREWVEESRPLADGDFAPAGGLWSTVRDMGAWMAFLMDAFPPRDEADALPLRRASRREMQQVQRARRSVLDPGDGRLTAGGYGFGLEVLHDLRFGHVVGHAGGLPGFGSHMRWLPGRGVGVVALANLTYAPMARATMEVLDSLDEAGLIPEPGPLVPSAGLLAACDKLARLLRRWDDGLADELFAGNVFLDQGRHRRRLQLQAVRDRLGDFRPGAVTAESSTRGRFIVAGEELSAVAFVMLSPEVPSRIMSYDISIMAKAPR